MNRLSQKYLPRNLSLLLLLCSVVAFLAGCATPAKHEGMIPTALEVAGKHSKTVSVSVQGGQETTWMSSSKISNEAFTEALVGAITKSGVFSSVIQGKDADYLLTVALFNLEQPVFGLSYTVKMVSDWTLQRADNKAVVWQESIKSEYTATLGDAIVGVTRLRLATEGAARDNIARGLAKISQLKL
ncbi:MAG: hypothetical protein M1147_05660 [Nitrospirae bacterium]|nr:hypothetical protein [Nitrospirota bacterium]MCL5977604.1 hypothetical protein [Nitrospirota bacterium]